MSWSDRKVPSLLHFIECSAFGISISTLPIPLADVILYESRRGCEGTTRVTINVSTKL